MYSFLCITTMKSTRLFRNFITTPLLVRRYSTANNVSIFDRMIATNRYLAESTVVFRTTDLPSVENRCKQLGAAVKSIDTYTLNDNKEHYAAVLFTTPDGATRAIKAAKHPWDEYTPPLPFPSRFLELK